ncbi:MAG: CBS domain-containing protein [Sedimentisphaerales bacterium]|nr:CBS domain-containing protein [Sedimentisphaerales bacterium]
MADAVKEEIALAELVADAMNAFCDDMATMFQVELTCTEPVWTEGPLDQLKRFFKRVYAVHTVKAEGRLEGQFYIVLDHAGLFTLGSLAIMLPDDKILELAKRGSFNDAGSIADAFGETGNLMVGAWERVFHKGLAGHKHLVKDRTIIGEPGQDPYSHIPVEKDKHLHIAQMNMLVSGYPELGCAVVIPDSLLVATNQDQQVQGGIEQPGPSGPDAPPAVPPSQAQAAEDTGPALATVDTGAGPTVFCDVLGIRVDQVMRKDVVWAGPDQDVQQVLRLMQSHDVGYVLMGQGGRCEGIVSRSTILAALSPYLRPVFARWRRPQDDATLTIRIRWFMSRPVRTIACDATIHQAARTMLQFGIRALVVLDAQGNVVGILTVFDVLRSLSKDLEGITPPQAPGLML